MKTSLFVVTAHVASLATCGLMWEWEHFHTQLSLHHTRPLQCPISPSFPIYPFHTCERPPDTWTLLPRTPTRRWHGEFFCLRTMISNVLILILATTHITCIHQTWDHMATKHNTFSLRLPRDNLSTEIMNVIGETMLTEFLNVRISVTDKV